MAAMTDEGSKTQCGEGRASSHSTTAEALQGGLLSSVSPPSRGTEKTVARGPTPTPTPAPAPAPEPPTLAQVQALVSTKRIPSSKLLAKKSSTTARRATEQRHKAKAKANLELGAMVAIFSFVVLSGWLCLPKEDRRPNNVRFTVSLSLAFDTFLSGKALMLLSMNMLALPERLVSGSQHVASKCLFV